MMEYRRNIVIKRDRSFSVLDALLASLFDTSDGLTSVLGAED